jgi:hypothetical protein
MTDPVILDRTDVAVLLGVHPTTVTRYVTRTRERMQAGKELGPSDIPLPDGHAGQGPWWWRSTIADWMVQRPGRTGRPRKAVQ